MLVSVSSGAPAPRSIEGKGTMVEQGFDPESETAAARESRRKYVAMLERIVASGAATLASETRPAMREIIEYNLNRDRDTLAAARARLA